MKIGDIIIFSLIVFFVFSYCKKDEKENTVIINVVKNGSFEEISGDSIIGWHGADTFNISHDVPSGGGNNSLILHAADVVSPVTQRIIIPFESYYTFSLYTKIEGRGNSGIFLRVKRGDSSFVLIEKEFKDTVWTLYEFRGLKLMKGDTLSIFLEALGGKWYTVKAYFDLIKLENRK